MSAESPDVLVLGGGPAGCAAARLLALWGHCVVLLTRRSSGPRLAESIPPSTGKLFEVLGVRDAIDGAGFVRSTGNTVWWGKDDARVEPFGGAARGWQVTGERLEAILQAGAASAGVRVEVGRATADHARTRSAVFTLDCTGRSGVVARARGWRVQEPGHRTVALVGRWRPRARFDLPDPTHTVVESYDDGWAWSVPDAGDDRYVAVMVDPRTSNLRKNQPAQGVYDGEINKTRRLREWLRDATLVDGPFGWDASMYRSTCYADADVLLVGDAGSFIDPLSSAGVTKALASGWLAAVAVHTSLIRPAMHQTALAFYAARETEVYAALRATTERHLAGAAAGHPHAFWTDRTEGEAPATSDDARVRSAFERIRRADALDLRRAADLRVEQRPAVNGCEIVLEPRLVMPDLTEGVRFVQGVDVVALVDLAPETRHVPDLFEAYALRCGPVPLPDFLTALSAAVAEGWLVERPIELGETQEA